MGAFPAKARGAPGKRRQHCGVLQSLNYGHFYEDKLASVPFAGLIEDWEGRFVLAGRALSEELKSPCETAAETFDDRMLDLGPACGGPFSIAMAR